MPYRDPDKQREAKREAARRARVRRGTSGMEPTAAALGSLIPSPIRLRSAEDALCALEAQINVVAVADAAILERARCVAYLVNVGLRAIESAILERRVGALEERLNMGQTSDVL